MNLFEKQRVLDVLNSLEWIETNGGDEAYILVENSEENHKQLNAVGITSETINQYADEETFCALSLAFGEGFCDIYESGKLIAFDKSIEVNLEKGKSIILYKHNEEFYLTISEDSGRIETAKLTDEQLQEIKNVIA
jgi:hypothetical protein